MLLSLSFFLLCAVASCAHYKLITDYDEIVRHLDDDLDNMQARDEQAGRQELVGEGERYFLLALKFVLLCAKIKVD